jgi:hypothetical protein
MRVVREEDLVTQVSTLRDANQFAVHALKSTGSPSRVLQAVTRALGINLPVDLAGSQECARSRAVHTEIVTPDGAPEWSRNNSLWSKFEESEGPWTAILVQANMGFYVKGALELVPRYCRSIVDRFAVPVHYSIAENLNGGRTKRRVYMRIALPCRTIGADGLLEPPKALRVALLRPWFSDLERQLYYVWSRAINPQSGVAVPMASLPYNLLVDHCPAFIDKQ